MASAFSSRSFRWLWTGSLLSSLSQWIQQATLGWIIYDITGSGAMLGGVLAMRAVPMILMSPVAGVAADRHDRKMLLILSQFGSAAVSAAFGAALALGWVRTWHLFLFVLFSGAAAVLDRPARVTISLELVPRELAMNAIAINSIGTSLARIVGPAIAGFLIAWIGAAGNFFVQAASYLLSGLLALLIVIPKRPIPAQKASAWKALTEGLRYVAGDAKMRLLVLLGAIPFFLLAPVWSTSLPVFAKDTYAAGPEGLGIMLTAGGVGAILGSSAAGLLGRYDRQGRVQVGSLLVGCAALFGFALSPSLWIAAACLVLVGGAEMVLFTSNQTMLQMAAPEAIRGRVASQMQLYPAVISLGGVLTGVLIDLAGARGATELLAGLSVLIVLTLYAKSPNLRRMKLSDHYNRR